jgi:hypothetical protein
VRRALIFGRVRCVATIVVELAVRKSSDLFRDDGADRRQQDKAVSIGIAVF